MVDEEEKKLSLPELELNWLGYLGTILTHGSNVHGFKPMYPELVKSIRLSKESLDEIGKVDVEFYNWAKNGFYFAKYFVEGMKDLNCWDFETEYFDRANTFLKAFIETTPDRFHPFMEGAKPYFLASMDANAGLQYMLKGQAMMAQGNYKEAAADFEKSMPFYCQTDNPELLKLSGIVETNYWMAKAMGYQYEDHSYLEAAKAFEKSSELYQREANKAALAEDIFTEGTFQSIKEICDRRAILCRLLHKKVENSPEFKSFRKKLNRVMSEYENQTQKVSSMSGSPETKALKELVKGIDTILLPIKKMKQIAPAFSFDSAFISDLYDKANDIKENIEICYSGLVEINQRKGTIEESPLDGSMETKYQKTIRRQITIYNDFLLPNYQQAVEEFLGNEKEIEAEAEKKRAKGKKIPEKNEIKKNLETAKKEVNEAKSLKTRLKDAYNSAAEFISDAKPYIEKLTSAAKFALSCLGFFL